MTLPPDHATLLSPRDLAAWAQLPETTQEQLLKGPVAGFRQGVKMAWLGQHAVDGRELWLEGLARARQWIEAPERLAQWLQDDLAGVDALMAVMDALAAGDLDSTQHLDRPTWVLLERARVLLQTEESQTVMQAFDYASGLNATARQHQY